MRKSVLLIVALICFIFTNAQFKPIAEGPVFNDFGAETCKILQLKNGNTLVFNFTSKDGISIRPYNSNHKEGEVVTIKKPMYERFDKNTAVEDLFEISGDAVIFVSAVKDKRPVLYRMIIDGNTGKAKEDKLIASIDEKVYTGFGATNNSPFSVKKDPFSDNYAVISLHRSESDRNKVIEVFHYGTDHSVISQAFVNSPGDEFKYLFYNDVVVLGRDKVYLLVFAKNTNASGGKRSALLLATLNAGDKQTTALKLDFAKDAEEITGYLKHNPTTKKLIVLVAAQGDKNGKYVPYLAYVDPVEKKLERFEEAYPLAASTKSIEMFGEKDGGTGLPQELYINKDGSFAVLYEHILQAVKSNDSRASVSWPIRTRMAVSRYDAAGVLQGSYLIPKNHSMDDQNNTTPPMSMGMGFAVHKDYDRFKTSYYINGPQKSFIVFNDLFDNDQLAAGAMPKSVDAPFACDAFSFEITGKDILLKRKYMFNQNGGMVHNLSIISVSDYNPESNIYATLKFIKDDKRKGVQVVWLQPQ